MHTHNSVKNLKVIFFLENNFMEKLSKIIQIVSFFKDITYTYSNTLSIQFLVTSTNPPFNSMYLLHVFCKFMIIFLNYSRVNYRYD